MDHSEFASSDEHIEDELDEFIDDFQGSPLSDSEWDQIEGSYIAYEDPELDVPY